MKNTLLTLISFIWAFSVQANLPAPEYWDENNLDVRIRGHIDLPGYTFYLSMSDINEKEETRDLINDEEFIRIPLITETTAWLWAEGEDGSITDSVLLSGYDSDYIFSITGIENNSIQYTKDNYEKFAPPIGLGNTRGYGSGILISISLLGLALLILLGYFMKRRRAKRSIA